MRRKFLALYWGSILWLANNSRIIAGVFWLMVATVLGYKCFNGSADDVVGYSRYTHYPETYKMLFGIWVAFPILVGVVLLRMRWQNKSRDE